MVELPDMKVVYSSWRNDIEENTVTYPHEAPEVGGIDHLSSEEQEDIMNTEEVPQHLCCSDPYWLFRIYQDTIVDIQSLLSVLESTKNKQKLLTNKKEVDLNGKLYPSKVINLTCQIPFKEAKPALWLSWKPPINLPFLATKDVKYEVWIQVNQAVLIRWKCIHAHTHPSRQQCQTVCHRTVSRLEHHYESCLGL